MTSTTAEPGQKPERGKGTAVKGKPSGNENALGNGLIIFLTILSIRIVNALTIRTFFQPDEYFQALEPAWNLAFAGGRGWVTWVSKRSFRSFPGCILTTSGMERTAPKHCTPAPIYRRLQGDRLPILPALPLRFKQGRAPSSCTSCVPGSLCCAWRLLDV